MSAVRSSDWIFATTLMAVACCDPVHGSCPLSKLPIISNMNGPAVELPLKPVALAGAAFQSRPVQIIPRGSMVMCWAMSENPRSSVWNRNMPSIDWMGGLAAKSAWFGRNVWCMWTSVIRRLQGN